MVFFFGKDENGHNQILDNRKFISVLVALSIASGFMLLVLFMGYGLVKIPLRTWTYSDLNIQLERVYYQIARNEAELKKA